MLFDYLALGESMGVIPLTDVSRRPSRVPLVTAAIIAVNVMVFLAEVVGGDPFVNRWALVPADIMAGRHLLNIVAAMFMHASWSHILGNMVFLWAFGPEIEDQMGRGRYLAFYLLGGLAATAAQIIADPSSTVPNLGASGAIAAVMGAFLVTFPRDRIRSLLFLFIFVRVTYVPAALLVGVWFLMQLVSLGTVAQQPSGGVAYAAHVGGFIFGSVMARLFEEERHPDEL
ncbi:MAG TPA: rhomboid family intramembrane serine protease [Gemmatimonadales bacterium]|nr:rhomboid family intramembrane serine protease [Gemmatimonadales bacterium]